MNPFSYGTIVKGRNFYDRKEECARIVDTLSGGNNLVLYAPRRFGKTSLVFKAMEELEARGFICIYFDFMPVFSPDSFVRLYSRTLSEKQTNLQKFAQIFASVVKSIRPVINFGTDGIPEFSVDFAGAVINETVIAQLLDVPEKISGKDRRVILFFDEFQEIDKLSSLHFEGLLRSKIQRQEYVNYLFLGSKTHLLKELFNDKTKAFYNAASQMSIGKLPQSETIAFMTTKFAESNIKIELPTIEYIISITADIPHYIQLLAAEIWQYAINTYSVITLDMVKECVRNVIALKSDYYMELFERQSQSRKQLLRALAESGKNIFSTAYIQRNRLPGAATLQRAVGALVTEGTVEKTNDEYFIADPFFKIFLQGI